MIELDELLVAQGELNSESERDLLLVLSVFPEGLTTVELSRYLRSWARLGSVFDRLTSLEAPSVRELVMRLIERGLVIYVMGEAGPRFMLPPLIRARYTEFLGRKQKGLANFVHRSVASLYAGDVHKAERGYGYGTDRDAPTLGPETLKIGVVRHLCAAEMYDEAYRYMREEIDYGDQKPLVFRGAHETLLALSASFFSDGEFSDDPRVSSWEAKTFILNRAASALASVGRLDEALSAYRRAIDLGTRMHDMHNVSIDLRNLAGLQLLRGELLAAERSALDSLEIASRVPDDSNGLPSKDRNKSDIRTSLAWIGWISHVLGKVTEAKKSFAHAEHLEQEIDPNAKFLYQLRGIQYTEHLIHVGNVEAALVRAEFNLHVCMDRGYSGIRYAENVSLILSQLGRLMEMLGAKEKATAYHTDAVQTARQTSIQRVIINALTARGSFLSNYDDVDYSNGLNDLRMALKLAVNGGFRIAEADIRIELARTLLSRSNEGKWQAEIERARARRICTATGYYWGLNKVNQTETTFAA